jgi:hypothetical protein
MNIDERIDALTVNHKLAMERIQALAVKIAKDMAVLQDRARQDGERIRALLCIAESRQRG